MSLLMKALEKAAKDRGEARAEPAPTAAETRPELSLALELLAADTPSPRLREERPEASARQDATPGYYRSDAAHAAAVMQAGQDVERGAGAYLRDHPVIVFGILAALFAIGFGAYVYLQIFHPQVFIRHVPPAMPPRVVEAPLPATTQPQPIPTAALIQSPPSTPPPSLVEPAEPVSPQAPTVPPPEPAAAPQPPKPVIVKPAEERAPAQKRNAIVVKRGDAPPVVNPLLSEAWTALQDGRNERANQLYAQLLRSEPKNTDALLGLAAIAVREGRPDDAVRYYRAILESDPRHALAQSGLIGLTGRADPLAAESHLKQLIAREPKAYTFFMLGNLYADQSLWAQAQQAYFHAHHLEPDNPDYAYNLAVGLDHISQPRLALGFYRRAVELASARPQINFDPARARERISSLVSQAQ